MRGLFIHHDNMGTMTMAMSHQFSGWYHLMRYHTCITQVSFIIIRQERMSGRSCCWIIVRSPTLHGLPGYFLVPPKSSLTFIILDYFRSMYELKFAPAVPFQWISQKPVIVEQCLNFLIYYHGQCKRASARLWAGNTNIFHTRALVPNLLNVCMHHWENSTSIPHWISVGFHIVWYLFCLSPGLLGASSLWCGAG